MKTFAPLPDQDTITIEEAAQKYGVPVKRILGLVMRAEKDDPLAVGFDGQVVLLVDDWRLQRLTT